jgi:hypothetical protein
MARIAFADPAPPTMKNSLRFACWIAASTPTPWSSSWFHTGVRAGCGLQEVRGDALPALRGEVRRLPWPDREPVRRQRVLEAAAALLGQRQAVDAGDLRR